MGEIVTRNMLDCFKKINKRKSCYIFLISYGLFTLLGYVYNLSVNLSSI